MRPWSSSDESGHPLKKLGSRLSSLTVSGSKWSASSRYGIIIIIIIISYISLISPFKGFLLLLFKSHFNGSQIDAKEEEKTEAFLEGSSLHSNALHSAFLALRVVTSLPSLCCTSGHQRRGGREGREKALPRQRSDALMKKT